MSGPNPHVRKKGPTAVYSSGLTITLWFYAPEIRWPEMPR